MVPATKPQHLCKELRRLLGGERRQDEEMLYPLDVSQLVRSQQAASKLCVRVGRERVGLHYVDDQTDRRLREDVQAILDLR